MDPEECYIAADVLGYYGKQRVEELDKASGAYRLPRTYEQFEAGNFNENEGDAYVQQLAFKGCFFHQYQRLLEVVIESTHMGIFKSWEEYKGEHSFDKPYVLRHNAIDTNCMKYLPEGFDGPPSSNNKEGCKKCFKAPGSFHHLCKLPSKKSLRDHGYTTREYRFMCPDDAQGGLISVEPQCYFKKRGSEPLSDEACGDLQKPEAKKMICLPTAQAQPYKFYRFTPTKLRGAGGFQIADIAFRNNGEDVATNTGQSTYAGHYGAGSPGSVFDDDADTKVCCSVHPVIFEFPTATPITSFRFRTGNDSPGRDPVQWTLDGSQDQSTWATLNAQSSDFNTPANRKAWTQWFAMEAR